jgi:hypothetical protein
VHSSTSAIKWGYKWGQVLFFAFTHKPKLKGVRSCFLLFACLKNLINKKQKARPDPHKQDLTPSLFIVVFLRGFSCRDFSCRGLIHQAHMLNYKNYLFNAEMQRCKK